MVASISVNELKQLLDSEVGVDVVDVRSPAEYQSMHVTPARNIPLDRLDRTAVAAVRTGNLVKPLVFICHSGKRSLQACERLIAAGEVEVKTLEGGTVACVQAGLPITRGRKSISIPSQVSMITGGLSTLGAIGSFWNPLWSVLPALMGAGLLYSGITDSCMLGNILSKMPWNTSCCSAGNSLSQR